MKYLFLLLLMVSCSKNKKEVLFDDLVLCIDKSVYVVKEHIGDTYFITQLKKQKCNNDRIIKNLK